MACIRRFLQGFFRWNPFSSLYNLVSVPLHTYVFSSSVFWIFDQKSISFQNLNSNKNVLLNWFLEWFRWFLTLKICLWIPILAKYWVCILIFGQIFDFDPAKSFGQSLNVAYLYITSAKGLDGWVWRRSLLYLCW